jgi:2-polyprenyl-3-methyl-5-hydroxy-6-metoxy-1,4-benzoquinol methylase
LDPGTATGCGHASFTTDAGQEMCPLCRQGGSALYADLEDLFSGVEGRWAMRACGRCRIAWLTNRPPESDFEKLYRNYFTHAPGEPAHVPNQIREKIKNAALAKLSGRPPQNTPRMFRLAGALAIHIPRYRELLQAATGWVAGREKGTLLDVGCGDGAFLKRMRALGWIVRGIDPDRQAVQRARENFSLDVVAARLEDHRFPGDFFDAVVVSHVIEHVRDPVSLLTECRRILKPGGKLVLLTPNYLSLQRRWLGRSWIGLDCPRHLFIFSRRSLGRCSEIAGLRIVTQRTTARAAKNFWLLSRARVSAGWPTVQRKPSGLRVEAFFYDWIERLALIFWPDAGAEILMIASK